MGKIAYIRPVDSGIKTPNSPTGLHIVQVTSSTIQLGWNVFVGILYYVIRRNGVQVNNSNTSGFFTDINLTASTTYTYQVSAVNAFGEGPPATIQGTTSAGTHQIKWDPGHYANSGIYTTVGNVDFSGNPAGSQKLSEINLVRGGPAQVLGWCGYYTFSAFWNNGTLDCSSAGSGLDADYTAITGYVSGTVGVGAGPIYNNPRRFALNVLLNDFFSNSAQSRVIPQFMLSSNTYGPVGPDGVNYAYWTAKGGAGPGKGAVLALWRTAVMTQFINFHNALARHVLPDGYTLDTSPYVEYIRTYEETATVIPVNLDGTSGNAADSTYSIPGTVTLIQSLNSSVIPNYPHTNVVSDVNYMDENGGLVQSLPAARSAIGGPDILAGASFGTNVPQLTWGQAQYIGLVAPSSGDPFQTPWVAGGTDLRGNIPYIATEEGDPAQPIGPFLSNLDLFNQANGTLHCTHLAWGIVQGLNGTGANDPQWNWFGNAANQAAWNMGADTKNGILTTIVNNALTHTAYPTGYP